MDPIVSSAILSAVTVYNHFKLCTEYFRLLSYQFDMEKRNHLKLDLTPNLSSRQIRISLYKEERREFS